VDQCAPVELFRIPCVKHIEAYVTLYIQLSSEHSMSKTETVRPPMHFLVPLRASCLGEIGGFQDCEHSVSFGVREVQHGEACYFWGGSRN